MDFSGAKVVVVVFVMHGCGACDEYLPRFAARTKARGISVLRLDKGQKISRAASQQLCLPVLVVDANSDTFSAWMDKLKIQSTPTTCVLRRSGAGVKVEGAIPDEQIETVLETALRGLRCEV